MVGNITLTIERKSFIINNWKSMTDLEIGKELKLYKGSVATLRHRLNLYRNKNKKITWQQKGFIINAFFNDVGIKQTMKMTGLGYRQVARIITENCFHKQRSYNTITLVMDSKVNYD